MRITQLTSLPGGYREPVFSPDGKQIAYIRDEGNAFKGDLYVQLVGAEKPLRLTHTTTGFVCCADWSPDGQQIVFGRLLTMAERCSPYPLWAALNTRLPT